MHSRSKQAGFGGGVITHVGSNPITQPGCESIFLTVRAVSIFERSAKNSAEQLSSVLQHWPSDPNSHHFQWFPQEFATSDGRDKLDMKPHTQVHFQSQQVKQ